MLQTGDAKAQTIPPAGDGGLAMQPGLFSAQELMPWLVTEPGGALPIPPVLSPPVRDDIRTFDLNIQFGQVAFEP